jgi:hypothetical protein
MKHFFIYCALLAFFSTASWARPLPKGPDFALVKMTGRVIAVTKEAFEIQTKAGISYRISRRTLTSDPQFKVGEIGHFEWAFSDYIRAAMTGLVSMLTDTKAGNTRRPSLLAQAIASGQFER